MRLKFCKRKSYMFGSSEASRMSYNKITKYIVIVRRISNPDRCHVLLINIEKDHSDWWGKSKSLSLSFYWLCQCPYQKRFYIFKTMPPNTVTKSWLRKKRIRVLDWLSYSPDLSSIVIMTTVTHLCYKGHRTNQN